MLIRVERDDSDLAALKTEPQHRIRRELVFQTAVELCLGARSRRKDEDQACGAVTDG